MTDTTCGHCDEFYTDPRLLPCLHTFCLQCLDKEESEGSLQCPNCKEKVVLSPNGVSDLPKNLRMAKEAEIARISKRVENETGGMICQACGRSDSGNVVAFCIDCEEFLCNSCTELHGRRPRMAGHVVVTAGRRLDKAIEANTLEKLHKTHVACSLHDGYTLEFYCKRCKELICRNCMDFDHRQHQEMCNLIGRVAEEEKESLREGCLQGTQAAVASLNEAIGQCEEIMEKVEKRKNEVDAIINNSLEQIKVALLKENEELCSGKIGNLATQLKELQGLKDRLSHAATTMKDSESYSPAQLLSMKETLAERAAALENEFEDSKPKQRPSENDVVVTALAREDIISFIISVGRILGERSNATSSSCDAGYVPCAIVGKERTIKVIAKDEAGNPCGYGGKVEAKLVSNDSQNPAVRGKITDHGEGTYSVTVTAVSPGEHELHVKIAMNHVKGSPFKFHVASPKVTAYTELSAQQPITTNPKPYDVAVTEEGQLAVAEYGSHTVSLYSVTGQRIYSFGTAVGNANGQFNLPSAVAIRGDVMYVCDQGNNRVQKFNVIKKSFLSKFDIGDRHNSTRYNICVDPEGKVFVADYSKNRIQVFRDDNSFVYSFDCHSSPWGLAFDLQGRLHVAASGSNCIHVFTPEGTLITSYGSGTVSQPAGIAIDAEGYVAISQWKRGHRGNLWIYGPDHLLVHTLTRQFSLGGGVACDKEGSFWVADSNRKRIAKL